jgi:hypothetical protein
MRFIELDTVLIEEGWYSCTARFGDANRRNITTVFGETPSLAEANLFLLHPWLGALTVTELTEGNGEAS